jgi:hypothetical protein
MGQRERPARECARPMAVQVCGPPRRRVGGGERAGGLVYAESSNQRARRRIGCRTSAGGVSGQAGRAGATACTVSQPVLKRLRVASDASTTGDAQAASDASRGASQTGRRCVRGEQRERGEQCGRGIEMGGERGGDGDGLGTRWERARRNAGCGRRRRGDHTSVTSRAESESKAKARKLLQRSFSASRFFL